MDILIASNNKHKIDEIQCIIGSKFDNVYTLSQLDINCDPEENGETFLDNALIKAREIAKHTTMAVVADDTGLCVHALNNAPGIHSARYAGNHDDRANRVKLLSELAPYSDRSAHFQTVIALVYPDGTYITAEGRVDGSILLFEEGDTSFGYDCIFYCDDLDKSFGVATSAEKNLVSHRARALHNLLAKL